MLDCRLIQRQMFDFENVDEVIECRDDLPFETEWLRVYNKVVPESKSLSDAEKSVIYTICKNSYLQTIGFTENPELAAFVSDDLGLVASALALNYSDPWLNGLWESYRSGRFPHRGIEPIPGELDLMNGKD